MKIGIITLPLIGNYGGIIQAYALQKVLKDFGNEVCLIEKCGNSILKKLYLAARYVIQCLNGHSTPLFGNNQKETASLQKIDSFISNNINRINVRSYSQLNGRNFDCLIVGSDQVWRPKYFGKYEIFNAFLLFAKRWHIKRIAYAASFGTDKWEYSKIQTWICKNLIRRFCLVSVREKSGGDFCKKYFGIKAQVLIDPTMLLTKEDYINLFEKANTVKSCGSLLVYILDETKEKMELIDNVVSDLKLVSFNVAAPINKVRPSIEQWIRGFFDAEFIVTDSFHACVFSILFQKPFIVFGNKERGLSRFTSLLGIFGLEDRLITSFSEFNQEKYKPIDWNKVFSILSIEREKSLSFLRNALKQDVNGA